MAQRTRQEYLKDLATNYCTNTTIDSGPKFCKYCEFQLKLHLISCKYWIVLNMYLSFVTFAAILSFGGRKKERSRPRFIPDSYVLGAISWQVQVSKHVLCAIINVNLKVNLIWSLNFFNYWNNIKSYKYFHLCVFPLHTSM